MIYDDLAHHGSYHEADVDRLKRENAELRAKAAALQTAIDQALQRIVLSDDSSVTALVDVTDILRAAVGAVPETRRPPDHEKHPGCVFDRPAPETPEKPE